MSKLLFALACAALVACSDPAPAAQTDLTARIAFLAERGDADAQYHLGMFYNNGIGVTADPAKALQWFEKSAAAGNALAAYKLGCYHAGQFGDVVVNDEAKALHYKRIAADAGYALAQSDVGVIHANRGEMDAALGWWRKAAGQGSRMALFNLSAVYWQGKGAGKDPAESLAYFELAKRASGGDVSPRAQSMFDDVRKTLSPADLKRVEQHIAVWRPQPTALTISATNGLAEAEALVDKAR